MSLFENIPALDQFDWGNKGTTRSAEKGTSSSENEESKEALQSKNKKRRKRKIKDMLIDEEISKVATFDPTVPDYQDMASVDECERLVLAFPNSSKAWLLYMVFHLKQAEVDKARNVANKALRTISFREEKDKYNMWVAMLNLENLYGTQQSLTDVFQSSLSYNEPKDMYNHLANLYSKCGKTEETEQLLTTMVKKFKQDKDIWIKLIAFYMKAGKPAQARSLMDRSLKSLDKKYHADVMACLACLEYEHGDAERGKTMFENLINVYPKRRDILATYTNLLSKSGNLNEAVHFTSSKTS